nr:putative transporter c11d3.18c [Quercus suber]
MDKLQTAQHVDVEDRSSDGRNNVHVVDPVFERRIIRKLDFHIMPWIFVLWLLAFIDRSNIGNAKLDGLVKDLNLTGNKYNVALTVFYILYVLVDVPSNWLLKIVGGGRYIPLLAIAWGIVGTCIGAVKSYGGLIACRLLLGACEA